MSGFLNGQTMTNGQVYQRMYDFSRDAWYQLGEKLTSVIWHKKGRKKYLPIIYDKLLSRIEKGSCSKSEVINFLKIQLRNRKELKSEINYYISEINQYKSNLRLETKKNKKDKSKSKKLEIIKPKEYNIIIKNSNVFINGTKVKKKKLKRLISIHSL
jgi:hypothetical protein